MRSIFEWVNLFYGKSSLKIQQKARSVSKHPLPRILKEGVIGHL